MAKWKRTSRGSSRNTEMWTRQLLFLKSPLDKETMGHTTNSETSKFWRLLMKRTKQNHLCEVPACSARAWLAHIWKDVPSARPDQDLLVSCVVRWLSLARRPLWDTRTPFQTDSIHAAEVKCQRYQRFGPLNCHSGVSNFQFLLVEPPPFFLVQSLVESSRLAI